MRTLSGLMLSILAGAAPVARAAERSPPRVIRLEPEKMAGVDVGRSDQRYGWIYHNFMKAKYASPPE